MKIPFALAAVAAVLACHVFSAEPPLTTQVVKTGFSLPVFVCAPPGDATRLFVIEQHSGAIKIIHLADGSVSTFVTVTGVTTGGEQGLLGMAFHPQYATNGFFYVNYTTTGGGAAGKTVVARYHATDADNADPASRAPIISFNQPEENHNGGWIGFGSDGFLYIAAGDGGGGNDQHGSIGNGQDRSTLLGKILRIDVDSATPYAIPTTNPFFGSTSMAQEIWAFGLRNPWRCSFDRANGNLWIGDVGQGAREEIDFIANGAAGKNFGWRAREGKVATSGISETPVTPATDPVYDYPHANGNNVVIGGNVYRGTAIVGLQGTYFFNDFGGQHFWSFRSDGTTVTAFTDRTSEIGAGVGVTSYGEDANGELYMCDYGGGRILKIVGLVGSGENHAPEFTGAAGVSANPAMTGADVTFTAQATDVDGDALTYTWEFGDGTTASGASVTKSYAQAGVYSVKVTVSDGQTGASQGINLVVEDQPSTGSFTMVNAKFAFNFVKPSSDSLSLMGVIPVSVGFDPNGKTARVVIGALDRTYTLNSKGVSADGAFRLHGKFTAGSAKFTLNLRKQALFDALAPMGLSKTQDSPEVDFSVLVVLDGQSSIGHRTMDYRVRVGRNGPMGGKAR